MNGLFPTITAHAGSDGSKANTVDSALLGLDLGADLVEVDVRSTADGIPVLHHDDEVGAAGGRTMRIGASRREELEGIVVTLDELFSAVLPGKGRINLDIKDDRSVPLVIAMVRSFGAADRVVFTGCETERARMVRRLDTGLTVYLNTDFGPHPNGEAAGHLPSAARIESVCGQTDDIGCVGLNINHRYCTRGVVELAKAAGLEVSVWTVAPEDGFDRFIGLDVDNITTRHVARLATLRTRFPQS